MNTPSVSPNPALKAAALILGISLTLVACSGPPAGGANLPSVESTRCGPKVAEIRVGDGFLQILCGCNGPGEANGTLFPAPGGLTCTLPSADTQVFFFFMGNSLQHQIISVGDQAFAASPLIGPGSGSLSSTTPVSSAFVHAVGFDAPSTTYSFKDAISGLTGQIIVP